MKSKVRSSRRGRRRRRIIFGVGGALLGVLLVSAVFVSLLRWQARTLSDQTPPIVYDDQTEIEDMDEERALNEILARYYDAVSSELGLDRLGSYHVGGVYVLPDGSRLDFSLVKKAPNQVRFSINRRGVRVIQAFNGETAWEARKFSGELVEATPRDPEELPELMRNAWATSDLYEPEEKGLSLRYAGTVDFHGREAYEIVGEHESGGTTRFFLDAETFYELGRVSNIELDGEWVEEESIMSGHAAVDGFVFPHRVETYRGGELMQTQEVTELQVNQGLFDWFFEKP
ncbi:MAG: hypothetical protein JJU00_05160 [Opitutales bacterium]|nr:hypothetical protein [Opitutales bacterium]